MTYIFTYNEFLNENKSKKSPKWHDSDAPESNGRFRDLGPKDLASWLIKTRKGDLKRISGSLNQQIVFNRNEDPDYADKMERTRKEVYKQLDRKDLIDESIIYESTYTQLVGNIKRSIITLVKTAIEKDKLPGYKPKLNRTPSTVVNTLAKSMKGNPYLIMLNVEKDYLDLGSFTAKNGVTVNIRVKIAKTDKIEKPFILDGTAVEDSSIIDVIILLNTNIDKTSLNKISSEIIDLVRHEIEHITQRGEQLIKSKWIDDNKEIRSDIRRNPEKWYEYYILDDEVDANIQGLYNKSKYDKVPFQSTVDNFLDKLVDDNIVNIKQRDQIYSVWKKRIPKIGGIPKLK